MKNMFPGHFKESKSELKRVWDIAIFIFDANILLNLYRYSDSTRNEFVRILNKIEPRIWLPHRAAEEYLNNRLIVIDQQEKSYDDTIKSIHLLKRDLDNARQHPFVSKKTMRQVEQVFEILCEELSKKKESHTKRITSDEIKVSISKLFTKSIGPAYERERMEQIIAEGKDRYEQKTPPGFKDGSKMSDSEIFSEKCRKYGDLIVWQQVIDKSIETEKPIVLVTDDKKEDWWNIFKGKTIGPRPELVKEFLDKTGNMFHMYQADRFLELARENLDEAVSEEIVEEIREVRRRGLIARREVLENEYKLKRNSELLKLKDESNRLKSQMLSFEQEKALLNEKMSHLDRKRREIAAYRDSISIQGRNEDELESKMNLLSVLEAEYRGLSEELKSVSFSYDDKKRHLLVLESKLASIMEVTDQRNTAHSGRS